MDALGWILVNICNQMRQWPIYIAASLARDFVLGKDYFICSFLAFCVGSEIMKLLYRNGIYFGGFVNLMSWLRFCLLVLGWFLLMISNFSLVIEFAKQAKKDQYPNECLKWPGFSVISLDSTTDTKKCEHNFDLNMLCFLQTQVFMHIIILSGPIINDVWTTSTRPIQLMIIFHAIMDVSMIQSTSWNS